MKMECDVLILGSGVGGSILAAALAKSGCHVGLVDTVPHPRFAIGESSTPLADRKLLEIAQQYSLPELIPLTTYGRWKQTYPKLTCGLKRGFSYFGHSRDADFDSSQQLLAAASLSDSESDTHWLRSDVDTFLFELANKSGARSFVVPEYQLALDGSRWHLHSGTDPSVDLASPFIVDATGAAGVVPRFLKVEQFNRPLEFQPSATFAHFANLPTVESLLHEMGVDTKRHPFPCDAAAVHHVLEGGWMWQLRFDDGTCSVGIMSIADHGGANFGDVWERTISRYPLLNRQFQNAEIVRPEGGLRHSAAVRRLFRTAAGSSWAAMPATAGFVDPLHSTGIAHTLFGVQRLLHILAGPVNQRTEQLQRYSDRTIHELDHIGRLVDGCYAALPSFRLWKDWCMVYFTAATSAEQDATGSFLNADDPNFQAMLQAARHKLQTIIDRGAGDAACGDFELWLKDAIDPYNTVGLMDPRYDDMYDRTAAPPLHLPASPPLATDLHSQ